MVKRLICIIFSAALFLCFIPSAGAEEAPDSDAVISQNEEFVPLYTTSPDSTLKNHSNDMTEEQGIFFYTQTTFLALIAGYLIIFKIKCIPKGERMHRRRKLNK